MEGVHALVLGEAELPRHAEGALAVAHTRERTLWTPLLEGGGVRREHGDERSDAREV